MGIVNVTPDSFSDGGAYATATTPSTRRGRCSTPVRRSSTSVGSRRDRAPKPVSEDEELRRVLPVVEALAGIAISVDTSRAEVARRALGRRRSDGERRHGTSTRRPSSPTSSRTSGADLCLMHMQGEPRTMQAAPQYDERRLGGRGVPRGASCASPSVAASHEERICSTPGSASGRRPTRTSSSSRRLDRIVAIGRPVLVGVSRKSTLARITIGPEDRVGTDAASVGAAVAAFDRGATLFRVHDVRLARRGARGGRSGRAGYVSGVTIELQGIELHGFHGVLEHERAEGQRFLVDVELDLADETAATSDRIEDAVDYRDVVAAVVEVSEARAYQPARGARVGACRAALLVALSRRRGYACACASPTSCLSLPVDHAAVVVEAPALGGAAADETASRYVASGVAGGELHDDVGPAAAPGVAVAQALGRPARATLSRGGRWSQSGRSPTARPCCTARGRRSPTPSSVAVTCAPRRKPDAEHVARVLVRGRRSLPRDPCGASSWSAAATCRGTRLPSGSTSSMSSFGSNGSRIGAGSASAARDVEHAEARRPDRARGRRCRAPSAAGSRRPGRPSARGEPSRSTPRRRRRAARRSSCRSCRCQFLPSALATRISAPGAARSTYGERLEKDATAPERSVAATVVTCGNAAG